MNINEGVEIPTINHLNLEEGLANLPPLLCPTLGREYACKKCGKICDMNEYIFTQETCGKCGNFGA